MASGLVVRARANPFEGMEGAILSVFSCGPVVGALAGSFGGMVGALVSPAAKLVVGALASFFPGVVGALFPETAKVEVGAGVTFFEEVVGDRASSALFPGGNGCRGRYVRPEISSSGGGGAWSPATEITAWRVQTYCSSCSIRPIRLLRWLRRSAERCAMARRASADFHCDVPRRVPP